MIKVVYKRKQNHKKQDDMLLGTAVAYLHKMMHGKSLPLDGRTGEASMLVMGYQGLRYAVSLLELPHVVEPLATVSLKETISQRTTYFNIQKEYSG